MNKSGFTLIEILIVVLIVAILASVALPKYTRSIERARAAEAVNIVQKVDSAVYAYYVERQACPTKFNQINVSLPDTSNNDQVTTLQTKNFSYTLGGATEASAIPETACKPTLATRVNGGDYQYYIWRNYPATAGTKTTTSCTNVSGKEKGKTLCEIMDLYVTAQPK